MRQLFKLFLLTFSVCLSLPTYAGLDSGWYVGAGAGSNEASDMSIYDTSTTAYTVDSTSSVINLFAGFRYNPNFAIEGGHIHISNVKYHGSSTTNTGEVKGRVLFAQAVGVLPVQEQVSVIVKGGLYRGYFDLDDANSDVSGMSFNASKAPDTESGVIYGLGVNYLLTPTFGFRAEWDQLSEYLRNNLFSFNLLYVFDF